MTVAIIASMMLALGRAAGFMWTAPLIGDRSVPGKVRLIAAVGVALTIALARGPVLPETLVVGLPVEIMLGALTGFAGRLVLAAAEAAGQFLGLPFSLGFAATFDPALGESAMVTRRIILALASLAFLAADGLASGIRLMVLTPAKAENLAASFEVILAWSGNLLAIGLRFAAAATVAGLVANVGIALAARAAPSLNIFSVVLAAMLIIGGLVLVTIAPTTAAQLSGLAETSIDVMARVSAAQ